MVVLRVIVSVITTVFLFVGNTFGLWQEQIKSMDSVTKVEDGFYIMDYTYDYDINELMERGVSTNVGAYLYGLANVLAPEKGFACTTFNSVTPSGDYLLSRNFDYMDSPYCFVRTTPKDGYASISSISLYFFGYDEMTVDDDARSLLMLLAPYVPLDGINEKGLSIGILELETKPVFQMNLCKKDLTTSTMIRACLDKAATVDEAIEIFKSYDMRDLIFGECTYHYHIADAQGNSVIIEYVDNEIQLIYPEKKEGAKVNYQVATNFYLSEGVDDPLGMGHDRFETAYKALDKSKGVTTEKEAMKILDSVNLHNMEFNGYVFSTLWSTVYNTGSKTVDICFNRNFNKTYSFSVDKPLTETLAK